MNRPAPSAFSLQPSALRNVAVRLQYDGTGFVGSQSQAEGRTVQDELERAWQRFTGEAKRWTLAGRTDAGVHAHGQIANIRTTTAQPLTTIQRALNALLPPDMAVHAVWNVPYDFHARFAAVQRDYRYTILQARWPVPLLRTTTWHVAAPLDVAAMHHAAQLLLGEHDFGAFGVVEHGPTVRVCFKAACYSAERDGCQLVVVDVAANGFLRHMVRAIVGTLVEVGTGKQAVARFGTILADRDRSAARTAPPQGLSLMSVTYPDGLLADNNLNDQALVTN